MYTFTQAWIKKNELCLYSSWKPIPQNSISGDNIILVYYDHTDDSLGTKSNMNGQEVVSRPQEAMEQGKQQM